MRRLLPLAFLLILIGCPSQGGLPAPGHGTSSTSDHAVSGALPGTYQDMALVPGPIHFRDYGPFAVWFRAEHRTPALTVFRMIEHEFGNRRKRPRRFDTDESLPADAQVTHQDYLQARAPGYGPFSRGHMVAMASMDSADDERATFVTTNVCPQQEGFNSGPWSQLEVEVRDRVAAQTAAPDDRALIFTGAFYTDQDRLWIPIETRRTRVPGGFFKVVYHCGDDWVPDGAR